MSNFNQGNPSVSHLISSSNIYLVGNTSSGNALSVQQLGAGNVATFRTTTGATALFVGANGNVGIGQTNPVAPLSTVFSTSGIPDTTGSGTSNVAVRFQVGSVALDMGNIVNGNMWLQNHLITNWATNFKLLLNPNGGSVGIGTTDPATALHVYGGAITTRGPSGVYANLGGYMKPYVYTGVVGGLEIGSVNTSGTELPTIYISDGSRVGIGTTNPAAPLEVGSPATINFAASYGFYSGSGFTAGVTGNQSVGAKIAGYVWSTNGFLATSDARIKIVNPEPISNCLDAVNQLRVCKYEYIDKITDKSNKLGFIAQEVQQVIPESVTISESIVPNIFKMAESVQSNVITIANHGLVVGDTVKLVYGSGAVETNVCVVRDASTFQVEAEIKEESVFVYGKKVNDFLTLDHTQVFTCAIGAIQELSAENTVLKTQLASIEARLAAAGL